MLKGLKSLVDKIFNPEPYPRHVNDLYMEYLKATEEGAVDFGGADPLVKLGMDQEFEQRLKAGEEPAALFDDVLYAMVQTRSPRGVDICLEAGADPLLPFRHGGRNKNAIELASETGQTAIAQKLQAYTETAEYKARLTERESKEWHTLYADPKTGWGL